MPGRLGRVGLALAVGTVTAVVGVTISVPAQAAPERVLQGVDVDIDSSGRVETITSRVVGASGEEVTELGVGRADELPVRVQTSWRLGDRAGTDLADIEGESGRVTVELSVQNTTVRPQQVRYDFSGVSQSRWALVGTPLTVVASADLGEGSHGSVVVRDDLDPEAVTNGVLDRGDDDSARVQWAAMLAPPRLGASATLRLVQDTASFQPPRFDIAVQPGLVTDPSVRRLLEVAFSDEASSTMSLERRTIEMIGSVNSVLAEASAVLSQIQSDLGSAASQLGARSIADLQASSAEVSSSMAGLTADLGSLSSDIDSQLEAGSGTALGALKASVDDVKAMLGDPKALPPVPASTDGCTVRPARTGKRATVMEQLVAVSSRLGSLAEATDACRKVVTRDLARIVGVVAPDGACRPQGSAACSILGVGSVFSGHLDDMTRFRDELAGRFDATLVSDVLTTTEALRGAIEQLDTRVAGLGGGGTTGIDRALADLADVLSEAIAVLRPPTGPHPGEELADLATSLRATADAVDDALGQRQGSTASEQVLAIRDLACEVAEGEAATSEAHEISRLAVGADCGAPVPDSGAATDASLAGRVADLTSARDGLRGLDDRVEDLRDDLSSLTAALESALDEVEELRADDSPGLSRRVVALVCAVRALSEPEVELPAGCDEGTATTSPLGEVLEAVAEMEENQAGLTDEEINNAFAGALSVLESSSQDAAGNADSLSQAGQDAGGRVDGLIYELQRTIDGTGDEILDDGKSAVTNQRRTMDNTVREVETKLSSSVAEAVRAISSDVDASNRNIRASEERLLSDLRKVLIDLGERRNNGSGLLGSLVTGATSTGVSNQQIRASSQTAASFSRVRSEGLEELVLQQAQTALALQMQAEFPVFGIELPAGSTHTTVFSLQVAGE